MQLDLPFNERVKDNIDVMEIARWNVEFSFWISSMRTDHAMSGRRISVDVYRVGCA